MMNKNFRHIVLFSVLVTFIFGLANSGSHPTSGNSGYTGAPGDSVCSSCHSPNNAAIDGNVTINGLPSTLMTNTTYTITVTVTNPNGVAERSGFQMLALNGTNGNAGSMSNNSSNTQIKTVGGKNYFGHSPASNFPASNSLSFTVNWTSPSTIGTNPEIKFYASAVIANGNGSTSGDRFVVTNVNIPIESPASPISVSVVPLSGTSCFNTADGSASVNISGGIAPFNILWSNGQISQTATNLPAGNVSVTVTDAASSSATGSAVIPSPQAIVINTTGSIICVGNSNGTASASASGGTGVLNYFWSNGGFGPNQSGLSPGTYFVTVVDGNGCNSISSTIVSTSPPLNISGNIQNVSCNGGVNGAIIVSVNGGNLPYNFQWNNGANTSSLTGLSSGTYMLTVSDVAGCSKTASFVVNQPATILISLVKLSDAGCTGQNIGSVSYTISGGVSPYQISDSNGVPYSSVSGTVNNLGPGNFGLCVTDGQNCQVCEFIQIDANESFELEVDSVRNIACFGGSDGSIILAESGAGYIYLWSNGSDTNFIEDLSAGSYFVIAEDNGGCLSDTLFIFLSEPSELFADVQITEISGEGMEDGQISVSLTGGTSPYQILWENGDTTLVRNNLAAGTYGFTITDANGCFRSDSVFLNDFVCLLGAEIIVIPTICYNSSDGIIDIFVMGNNGPVSLLLTNDSGIVSFPLDELPSGFYNLLISDSTLCEISIDSIFISAPEEIVLDSFTIISPSDSNPNSGSIAAYVSGGTGSLTYNWLQQPLNILVGNSSIIDGLSEGIYSLQVIDSLGCTSIFQTIELFTVNTNESGVLVDVNIFPNPFQRSINIDFSTDQIINSIELLDTYGRMVEQFTVEDQNTRITIEPSVSLESGVYILRIMSDKLSYIHRILKIKN